MRNNWWIAKMVIAPAAKQSGAMNSSCGRPAPTVCPLVSRSSSNAFQHNAAATSAIVNATTASTLPRRRASSWSTTYVTPAFSPCASAAAAPRKQIASSSARATSSLQTSGSSNRKRDSTEHTTTTRSATSSTAAATSTTCRSGRTRKRSRLWCGSRNGVGSGSALATSHPFSVCRTASRKSLAPGVCWAKRAQSGCTR